MTNIDVEHLRARLAEIDAEREPLVALIKAAEAYEGVVGKTLFQTTNIRVRQRPSQGVGGRSAPIMAATERAVGEVLDLMGPSSISDLVAALRHKPELNLATENPNNVLSARLSNSKKFVGKRNVGWWFANRPWPGDEPAADAHQENEAPVNANQGWGTGASETAHTAP